MTTPVPMNRKITNQFLKLSHRLAPNYVHKKVMNRGFRLKKYRTSDEELSFLLSSRKKLHHLPITDESIYSYHWGNGPEIVLVHGWESRGVQFSKFIQPLVEKGYSVVAFDAPGHGDSEKKFSHIMEFIEALTIVTQTCHDLRGMICHSMGCTSTVKVLNQYFNTPATKLVWISGHLDLNTYLKNWTKKRNFPPEIMESLIKSIEDRYEMSFEEIQTINQFPKTEASTLLIHDKEDNRSSYKNALFLDEKLPLSQLHITEGLGHFKILKAKEIVDRVMTFL